MTDATYFAPKMHPQPREYIGLLRQRLITLDDYDTVFKGEWCSEAIQAAADLYREGGCTFSDFRRVIFKDPNPRKTMIQIIIERSNRA